MSYRSFSSALPKKLYVIKISDSNSEPGVRTELITASSAKKAVEKLDINGLKQKE